MSSNYSSKGCDMSKKINPLQFFVFVCVVVSVLCTLTPLSDIEHNPLLDSHTTDDFLHFPVFSSIAGFIFLSRFFVACIVPPRFSFSPFVPPPISHK